MTLVKLPAWSRGQPDPNHNRATAYPEVFMNFLSHFYGHIWYFTAGQGRYLPNTFPFLGIHGILRQDRAITFPITSPSWAYTVFYDRTAATFPISSPSWAYMIFYGRTGPLPYQYLPLRGYKRYFTTGQGRYLPHIFQFVGIHGVLRQDRAVTFPISSNSWAYMVFYGRTGPLPSL
jgi:hypothetical protein